MNLVLASSPDPATLLLAEVQAAREALARIESALVDLGDRSAASLALGLSASAAATDLGAMARSLYRARGLQAAQMSDWRIYEPAWDILLDLYASEAEGRSISVSSACVASRVPPTTGLRWVSRLEAAGMITRHRSEEDGRRVNLVLTSRARRLLGDILAKLALR